MSRSSLKIRKSSPIQKKGLVTDPNPVSPNPASNLLPVKSWEMLLAAFRGLLFRARWGGRGAGGDGTPGGQDGSQGRRS